MKGLAREPPANNIDLSSKFSKFFISHLCNIFIVYFSFCIMNSVVT
nr:MAG TPA: hypothetical protein [Caudoviricetes sp.]